MLSKDNSNVGIFDQQSQDKPPLMIKQFDIGEEESKNNNSVSKKMGIKSGNHSIKRSNDNSQTSRSLADNFNDEEQFSLRKKFDPIGKSFGLMSKLND